uniref:Uncharacterized protein n=1 Tax=Cajanus cajan TaxID=3821 RepID=A0A151QWK5_CAJCA|nr:hypothetical protein KK1_044371 [Cajanus cajan]
MTDLGSGSVRREGRSVTQLSGLTARRIAKERTQVDVDPRFGKASKKKLMKARAEASGVQSADLLDPPPRYEIWIAARTKSDGKMTSESARVIVDKIISKDIQTNS